MIRTYKVADIVSSQILYCKNPVVKLTEIAGMLTTLEEVGNPHPDFYWTFDVIIDNGPNGRVIPINLCCLIRQDANLEAPILLALNQLFYFKNKLFASERPFKNGLEHEEIILRIKKAHYDEELELTNLRAEVANIEATIKYLTTGPKRESIPESVKLLVWTRDGGACIICGEKANLHFDHIIPVAKGGGNAADNIQILCQRCNLRKSDKIAMI